MMIIFLVLENARWRENNLIPHILEYQVREYGYVIDSVATKHHVAPGVMGTQRLTLSDTLHIPFQDRGGIMGFEILPVTNDDFHQGEPLYDVFEITGSKTWTPARFRTALVETSNESEDPEPIFYDPEDAIDDLTEYPAVTIEFDEDFFDAHEDPDPGDFSADVHAFLSHLTDKELTGIEVVNPEYYGFPPLDDSINTPDEQATNDFHSFVFAVSSWHRVLYDSIDPEKLCPYLGFRPLEIIKKTIASTTQLARMSIRSLQTT